MSWTTAFWQHLFHLHDKIKVWEAGVITWLASQNHVTYARFILFIPIRKLTKTEGEGRVLTCAGVTRREQWRGAWIEGPPAVAFSGWQVIWPSCAWMSAMHELSLITSLFASWNPLGWANKRPPNAAMTGKYCPTEEVPSANTWSLWT